MSQVFFSWKLFTKKNLAPSYTSFVEVYQALSRFYSLRAKLLLTFSTAAGVELLKNNVAGHGTCARVFSWTPAQCMLHETSHL